MAQSGRLISFVRQNWLIVGVLAISLGAALWFVGNIALEIIYFNDPRHQDQALKEWMTPRYVVMSYDLPRPLVLEVLNLTPESERGKRMSEIAADMGVTLDDLTEQVRAAAMAHREGDK